LPVFSALRRAAAGFVRAFALAFGVLLLAAFPARPRQSPPNGPPPTRTDNVVDNYHGVKVRDPYRWLEDQNSPETRAWINAQNQFAEPILRTLPGRASIEARLGQLMKVDSAQVPAARNGRYFFLRRAANQDLSVLEMRSGLRGPGRTLVDPHPLSPDHSTSVELVGASADGSLIAYGVREGGADEITVHILDVSKRTGLPDQLPKGEYFSFGNRGVAFNREKSGFYYARMTAAGPRVFYHALGTDSSRDAEIFGKGYGPDKLMVVDLSDDGRYLVIHVLYGSGTEHSEIYYQDLSRDGPIVPLVSDIPSYFYGVAGGGHFFMATNWRAKKYRIFSVDLNEPQRDRWLEIIRESDAPIADFDLAGGKLLVHYTRSAASQLKVFEPDGHFLREIPLPVLGTVSELHGRWGSDEAFFKFESFAVPETIYRYDVARRSLEAWAKPDAPVSATEFEMKQVWYESKDKTRVPMFLIHRKGLRLDGSNPTYLTGYGGFDVSETPEFREEAVVWAERGGVYAQPNLRGGGELGEQWHHAGMLEKKQNGFDDFLAAAEWLIRNGYTRPEKLAIRGASNGGLLVGAAMTQRPDLFQAVVCLYPLLDMLRYQKFLVARWWVPEYGSSDNPGQFKYLYAYSPYQHVQAGTKYPAVLLITGDSDTRVAPLHARKMAARLQAATDSNRPVLLLYDTKSGHSGGRPLGKLIEEKTDILSFLFWQLGVEPQGKKP
jgi:prolyl oligopeptidase